jgi:hypothetical protein
MNSNPSATGYSAQVRLHLLIGGQSIELGQISPERIFLRESIELPPGPAEVVMHVDHFEQRWQVYLPDGISANSREARTAPASPAAHVAQ